MKEISYLGIRGTGGMDKRYNTERTASFSLFECSVCTKQYELITRRGRMQSTCIDCRGTQNKTHGFANTRQYLTWQSMQQRCNNPKNSNYPKYGAKGIVCDTTWNTFEGFWGDMENGYTDEMTIDRIDSSLGYNKSNCRWITQARNSSETTKRRSVVQLRQVIQPTKHFVEEKVWESAAKAAQELGLVAAHITATSMGQRKTHGGFGWKYLETSNVSI